MRDKCTGYVCNTDGCEGVYTIKFDPSRPVPGSDKLSDGGLSPAATAVIVIVSVCAIMAVGVYYVSRLYFRSIDKVRPGVLIDDQSQSNKDATENSKKSVVLELDTVSRNSIEKYAENDDAAFGTKEDKKDQNGLFRPTPSSGTTFLSTGPVFLLGNAAKTDRTPRNVVNRPFGSVQTSRALSKRTSEMADENSNSMDLELKVRRIQSVESKNDNKTVDLQADSEEPDEEEDDVFGDVENN